MSSGGRSLIASFRPFALKLCCFNLMCRWSTISFDSSSTLTRLDSWYIFDYYSFFWELPGSTMQCMILLFALFYGQSVILIASLLSILSYFEI